MISFLRSLFCSHQWESFASQVIFRDGEEVGVFYHQKCSKCGEVRGFKVMV